MSAPQIEENSQKRQGLAPDMKLLWIGIAFSIGFTFIIWFFSIGLQSRMEGIYGTFWPDFGAAWYYWQLPGEFLLPRITAWAFYLAHQVTLWVLTWRTMCKLGGKKPLWSENPDKDHYIILLVNLAFVILHLVQTQVWYDGLAQDVPIWTSQFSVILMLLLTLLIETPRRGFFWGKKLPIGKDAMNGMIKWHGYYIQWALVYTFWFHPMDGSFAMITGFAYMFLLLFQSSTFLLKVHLGRKWIVFLEVFVWLHGTIVALESDYIRFSSSSISWPIFFFGFMGMLVFTQQFGLTKKKAIHYSLLAVYIAMAIITFSIIGWNKVFALVSIPMAEYLGALAGWGLFALVPRLKNKRKATPATISTSPASR